jgi:hypothetical protein
VFENRAVMQRFRRWPATHLDMKWFVLMSVVAVAACLNPVSVGTVDGGCSEADCYVMSGSRPVKWCTELRHPV